MPCPELKNWTVEANTAFVYEDGDEPQIARKLTPARRCKWCSRLNHCATLIECIGCYEQSVKCLNCPQTVNCRKLTAVIEGIEA